MHRCRRILVTSLLVAALAVSGFAAPSTASAKLTRLSTMSLVESSYAVTILNTINAQRVKHRLKKVRFSLVLTVAALRHNVAMGRVNQISHQLPGERDFVARGRAAGWRPKCASGENIGVNARMDRAGAVELQNLMYNERPPYDGHRRNILNSRYTHVGIGITLDLRNKRLWLTTDFAQYRC